MSAESELMSMMKIWKKAMSDAGISGLAVTVRIIEGTDRDLPFSADMSLSYSSGMYIGSLIAAWPRETKEEAYACLLKLYGKGEHFKSTTIYNFFDNPELLFPPCSSSAELELKLAVEGMI